MLFSWLRKRRERREIERFEAQRNLFRFWDGRKWRAVDPWSTWRAIVNCKTFDFSNRLFLVEAGEDDEVRACVSALCQIFGVERYNDETKVGMTDWEILSIYLALRNDCDALKKNTSAGPTTSPPTDPPSSISPASPSDPTNSSSASCSMPSEASCDSPTAS